MPRLDEYQGKQLLSAFGIQVPRGGLARTKEEAGEVARQIGGPTVVKAQVGTTGRMKLGGIQFADSPDEVERITADILQKEVKGLRVDKVLVEQRLGIDKEFYASVIVNDSYLVKGPVVMLSTAGGTGIEETALRSPEKLRSINVDILEGIVVDQVSQAFSDMGVEAHILPALAQAVERLYGVFREYGAHSAEINPLVLTQDGSIYAVDCRIVIDEGSINGHPDLGIDYPRDLGRDPTALERVAWEVEKEDFRGTGYFVQMALDCRHGERCIGFMGLGGGGAMLSADALIQKGLKLADYADTSGNPPASKVYRITKIILSQPNIDGYAVMGPNIANQEQWHTAHGLVRALREDLPTRPGFPVVIFLAGNKEAESLEIVRDGLRDMPARIEIYGRDYITRVDYIAERMRKMVDDYIQERETQHE